MLRRIISGSIAAAILLLAMYLLPPAGIALLLGVFMMAGAWESMALVGYRSALSRSVYLVLFLVPGALGTLCAMSHVGASIWAVVFIVAALWWLAVLAMFRPFTLDTPGLYGNPHGRAFVVLATLVPAWLAIIYLYQIDPDRPNLLVYVLFLVWFADSGAYFAGKALGRHKLAPILSPGKTLEGLAGGALAVLIISWLSGWLLFDRNGAALMWWVGLSLVTMLISVVGDLNESALKRVAGVKDSGNILPGHGGVLDRIDAVTAAAPVFALGWGLLQKVGQ